ncbi:hypothetical protein KIN20_002259 [Parelaphostrongylus tenuis]|uniref:Uncharacterized protein n=1 Tax=Parelaphostrongylus tenuis TaxID=148309 RepID=A0AAD5MDY0_PARTN|nr:hypothetical protein KIN20_002259 [Parelaphostrongylus tenuis]
MTNERKRRAPAGEDECGRSVADTPQTSSAPPRMKRLQKMSAYDRAKKVYERIQEEKARERILRQQEREQRHLSLQKYLESKKKRNKVLRKCNKKGQPNLGAQVEILLEKLEKEDK